LVGFRPVRGGEVRRWHWGRGRVRRWGLVWFCWGRRRGKRGRERGVMRGRVARRRVRMVVCWWYSFGAWRRIRRSGGLEKMAVVVWPK